MVFVASFSEAANTCRQRQVVVDGIRNVFLILPFSGVMERNVWLEIVLDSDSVQFCILTGQIWYVQTMVSMLLLKFIHLPLVLDSDCLDSSLKLTSSSVPTQAQWVNYSLNIFRMHTIPYYLIFGNLKTHTYSLICTPKKLEKAQHQLLQCTGFVMMPWIAFLPNSLRNVHICPISFNVSCLART